MAESFRYNGFELWGFADWAEESAHAALVAGDALGFLCLVNNERNVELVYRNRVALASRGIYEAALVLALTACRTNNHRVYPLIRRLLALADKKKLRAGGDRIPGTGPFTLYRGVGGRGTSRRVRGYSWTADLERARWFAERLPLHDPAVYCAVVPKRRVLFYSQERKEAEFFVDLPAGFPVERLPLELIAATRREQTEP